MAFGHNNQPSGVLEAQSPEEASATWLEFLLFFFSSDSPADLVFTVAMVDTDGKPAGAAVEVGASGLGSKRPGEVAVQLDEVVDR